jgi:hypothetical protein
MTTEDIDAKSVTRTWKRVQEEEGDGDLVFRPADAKLPPARGRQGFSLASDGTMQKLGIGRDDRTSFAPGTWRIEGRTLTLRPFGGDEVYEIVSVDEDRMVLRRR